MVGSVQECFGMTNSATIAVTTDPKEKKTEAKKVDEKKVEAKKGEKKTKVEKKASDSESSSSSSDSGTLTLTQQYFISSRNHRRRR